MAKTTGKTLSCLIAITLLGASFAFAQGALELKTNDKGVSYIAGGFGIQARSELDTMAKDFTLRLEFALTSGVYIADVKTTIKDSSGAVVLDEMVNAPWLLAKLPAGEYDVTAVFGAASQSKKVKVDTDGLKTVLIEWAQ